MVVTSPNVGLQTAMPSMFKTFKTHCKEASNPGTPYKDLTSYLTTVRYLWSVYSLPSDNWWTVKNMSILSKFTAQKKEVIS